MSGENRTDIDNGNTTTYDQTNYAGQPTIYRWAQVESYFAAMESGTIHLATHPPPKPGEEGADETEEERPPELLFPEYTLRATELNADGQEVDTYTLEPTDDHEAGECRQPGRG